VCVCGEKFSYFCGFKNGATGGPCGRLFSICAALSNSFLENMSVAVLSGDYFAEVLRASLQWLLCCRMLSNCGCKENLLFYVSFGS
jgi:hypothetical protein